MTRQSLVFKAPFEIDIIAEKLLPPAAGEVLVQTRFSAISHGTEMLIYRGWFPAGTDADDTIPALRHPLQYPLKYGYAVVGEIIDAGNDISRDLIGQAVFCLHPHESCFTADTDSVIPVPADIDLRDALFLANMETAVNLLMDGKPVIGEKVAVFGQGVVGLLTTYLLAQFPLAALLTIDPYELRRNASQRAGAHRTLDPGLPEAAAQISAGLTSDNTDGLADLTYELSGNPEALNQAIAVTGFDGRIVVGSWYGSKAAAVDLSSRFHRRRQRLISSQVSTLTPDMSARWSHKRRFDVAWEMIRRIRPAGLITGSVPFSQAHKAYDLIDKDPANTIQIILEYEHG